MKKFLIITTLCITLTSCSMYDDKTTEPNTNTSNQTETDIVKEDSEPDATTTASITGNDEELIKSLSSDGNWITAITNDITLDNNLTVDGTFYDKNDTTKDVYRKLALYAQDSDKNVTDTYTLTVPEMIVSSENFRVQEGTISGDITVEANGFELKNTTVDGSITFANEEFRNSAKLDEGTITGEIK